MLLHIHTCIHGRIYVNIYIHKPVGRSETGQYRFYGEHEAEAVRLWADDLFEATHTGLGCLPDEWLHWLAALHGAGGQSMCCQVE